MRYESSQTQIDAIVNSLEKGRDQLKRDNVTLGDDQKQMRELTLALTDQIGLAQALDGAVVDKLATEIAGDDPRRQFVEEDILFALRQRTLDLQQQLAVNQQGVLAIEIIIRNNRELIRGVDRALDVTISALQVAVTVALALAHQKIVLDKIEAINTTTSEMIAGTAERLKTQGTQIHQQASSTMLDMESLKFRRSPTSTPHSSRSRGTGVKHCRRWPGRSWNSMHSRRRAKRRSKGWSRAAPPTARSSGSETIDVGEITVEAERMPMAIDRVAIIDCTRLSSLLARVRRRVRCEREQRATRSGRSIPQLDELAERDRLGRRPGDPQRVDSPADRGQPRRHAAPDGQVPIDRRGAGRAPTRSSRSGRRRRSRARAPTAG